MEYLFIKILQNEGISEVNKILVSLLVLACSSAYADSLLPLNLPSGVTVPPFFAKQGIEVMSYQKGAGGLHVWYVKRGATKTVLYTTPDNKVLLSAVLWDSATGQNVSNVYITPDLVISNADRNLLSSIPVAAASLPATTPAAQAVPAATKSQDGYSPNKPSDAIKGIATLAGIKEGKADIDKTLYIMFDPRCPYCHSVYKKTRQWVARGGSVKWIPTTVLGNKGQAAKLVASIMQASNPVFELSLMMTDPSRSKQNGVAANGATMKLIDENEAYFFSAFEKNAGAGPAGVPVAFFDTKAGMPQMVAGIDDDKLLSQIFSDIKK